VLGMERAGACPSPRGRASDDFVMDSIIILAHNKSAYTDQCLRSILTCRAEGAARLEVIVVDNGSTDETPALLARMKADYERAGLGFHVISNGRNIGACTARNQGLEAARGQTVTFMDNDTLVVDPHWRDKLRAALLSDEKTGMVGPKLCYPFEPHWIQCAGVGISRTGRVQFRGRGHPRDDPRFNRGEEVQALVSACMMFRRSLAHEMGGLDEAFNPIQYEDFDFCYRARSRGYRAVYTPDPEVHHWESITSDGTAALPNKYLVIKHGMLFKRRWRHMFEKEDGPPDEATKWRVIEMPSLDGRTRAVGRGRARDA